jgi:small subunit ribosomal protein S21
VSRTVQYVATTRGEGNAVDGRFSATCWKEGHMKVVVQDNQIEKAIRDLKKKLTKEGFFSEIKERRFYDKPSVQKKKKQAKAAKRRRKRMRKVY